MSADLLKIFGASQYYYFVRVGEPFSALQSLELFIAGVYKEVVAGINCCRVFETKR